jgi:hypothetical protein
MRECPVELLKIKTVYSWLPCWRSSSANCGKFPVHGLGIARRREIGKRGFDVAASRQSPALFSFFRWRLSSESRNGFPLSAFRFPL